MGDMISIIMPVYNSEMHLKRCVESVIGQTYSNLEIILVNDGSTDGSAAIIENFALLDKRITVVHQQNQGVSAARNAGLSICTGEMIGFMDADDEAKPDMYELLYRNMVKYAADISHCGFELVKPNEIVPFHGSGVIKIHDRSQGLREILGGQLIEPSACTKLYKRSVVDSIKFPEKIYTNEDLLFNIEAFHKAVRTVFEDQPKYRYISNATSASHSRFTPEKAAQLYSVASQIKTLLDKSNVKDDVEKFYAIKLLTILQALQHAGLRNTEIAESLCREIMPIKYSYFSVRTAVLKSLLMDFPFLYSACRQVYDVFFAKNQKWNEQ